MLNADNRTVGGHRLGVGDAESLSRTGRCEHVRGAHLAQHVLVLVEEAQQTHAVGVVQRVRLPFEAVELRAVADDAQRHVVVVVGHAVERIEEDGDVLVGDESPGEQHVERVALVGERRVANLVDVDAVRDDLDGVPVPAGIGETVGGDARDGDWVLGDSDGEVFGELPEGGEHAEVVVPVVAPHFVPGRDDGHVGSEGGEFRGEDGKVRKDGGDDEVVILVVKSFGERVGESGREVERFGDGAAVVGVELCFGGDRAEGDALVGGLFRAVPEVAAVDGHIVAVVSESGCNFVDALFCAAFYIGINDVRNKTDSHCVFDGRPKITLFRSDVLLPPTVRLSGIYNRIRTPHSVVQTVR